jgi:hypothetical protein
MCHSCVHTVYSCVYSLGHEYTSLQANVFGADGSVH